MSARPFCTATWQPRAPQDHWFDWLRDELADAGVGVFIPSLPESSSLSLDVWVSEASAALGSLDESTIVIVHSLGAITVMHALGEALGDWRLGRFVGVAGFAESLPTVPELDSFIETPPDLDSIARRATFVSDNDNDTVVPPAATRRMAEALDAPVTLVPGAGHFLGREGHTKFPELATLLREWK